ncbi:MAG: radical SAM protein [Promethearchaeota archaeon]
MVNPVKFAQIIEEQICRNDLKKYYRFRKTQFYGGCATADCLGCNLRCAYCWAQKKVWNHRKYGKFYSPKKISEILLKMNISLVRVSGGEPTIGKDHLLKLLNFMPENIIFILETNGILLNDGYIKELSKFNNIYVRVSLKGVDESTFQLLTGADGQFFHYQLKAIELLNKYKIRHGVAIIYNLFSNQQINNLGFHHIEYESLIKYPFVIDKLKERGINIIRN